MTVMQQSASALINVGGPKQLLVFPTPWCITSSSQGLRYSAALYPSMCHITPLSCLQHTNSEYQAPATLLLLLLYLCCDYADIGRPVASRDLAVILCKYLRLLHHRPPPKKNL